MSRAKELHVWERSLIAAKLSALAYKSEKQAADGAKKLGFPWAKLISKDGAEVLVAKDRNDLWFAFRGTEPSKLNDVMADLNVIKNEIGWTSGGINGTYALKNNSLRLTSGLDYMTNGSNDDSVQILGFKIGADWDLLNNLILSIKSNIRLNRMKANDSDGIDNDGDGKVDNSGEIWSTSNSGTMVSLNYRF